MKHLLTLCSFLLVITISSAQNGLVEKDFQVDAFTDLKVSSGVDVYLIEGSSHQVLVETSAEKMERMEIKQNGDHLSIGFDYKLLGDWGKLKNNTAIKVYVIFQSLQKLEVSGGSDIYCKEMIHADQFALKVSGGSDVRLDLQSDHLNCQISGGSDLYLDGSVKKLEAKVSGATDIKAKDCRVDELVVTISGASDMHVAVSSSLQATVSGASDLFVYGNPEILHKSVSGSSDFHLNDN